MMEIAMTNSDIKKVGIWVRVSTERQFEGDSAEVHEARAKAYAESKGWIVVKKYKLCVSGKSVFKHPETQRMLEDVEKGHIQALIFSKLARLARNVKELIELSDFFQKHDADIISLAESIDTSTSSGRLLFHVIAALAQWEGEEISERVYAGMMTRAKMGESVGGTAPFGYIWNNKKLVINKQDSVVAKDIFETFLKCKKIKTTAETLNQRGYRTKKGSLWSDTSVRRLLQSTTYKGTHYLNHTKTRGPGRGWDPKPKDEWISVQVESIVKPETWEEVNNILNVNSSRNTRKTRSYLLSGFLYCTRCRKKMYGYDYGRSKGYYLCTKCREKIEIQDLENIVIESFRNYTFNPKDLVGLPKGSVKDLVKKQKMLENCLEDIEKRIDELLELYHKKLINNVIFSDRVSKLEDRQMALKKEIPKAEEEISMFKIKEQSRVMIDQMRTISATFPQLTFQEQRMIMEELLESINIEKDSIDINLCFLPVFQKNLGLSKNCNEPMSLWLFYGSIS
jgi:site-specific DNA recombinase